MNEDHESDVSQMDIYFASKSHLSFFVLGLSVKLNRLENVSRHLTELKLNHQKIDIQLGIDSFQVSSVEKAKQSHNCTILISILTPIFTKI